MAVLGLRFCARASSSCGKWGPLFIAVRGPLTIAASLVAEHRLQTRRLSNCGSQAYSLRGMWDPPRPGLEPVSPALAGRLSITAPPGKPKSSIFIVTVNFFFQNQIYPWVTYLECRLMDPNIKIICATFKPSSVWIRKEYGEKIKKESLSNTKNSLSSLFTCVFICTWAHTHF